MPKQRLKEDTFWEEWEKESPDLPEKYEDFLKSKGLESIDTSKKSPGFDWGKAARIAGTIIAPEEMGVYSYMERTRQQKQYQKMMFEERVKMRKSVDTEIVRVKKVGEATAAQAQKIAKIEETTKLINQTGGAVFNDEQAATDFGEKHGIPEELFTPVIKEGKPTGKWKLFDPDAQDKFLKMTKLMLQQSQQHNQQIMGVMSAMKMMLDMQTPKTIFKGVDKEGQPAVMGIYPGGGIKKLGDIPPPPIPANVKYKLGELEAGIESLNNLESLFDEAYVGPAKGRVGLAKDVIGTAGGLFKGNPQKQSNFYAASSALENQIIKLITGAQMGEKEADRIKKQIPRPYNPPKVWRAKLEQSRRNRETMLKIIEKRLKSGKKIIKSTTKTPRMEDFSTMTAEQLEEFIAKARGRR